MSSRKEFRSLAQCGRDVAARGYTETKEEHENRLRQATEQQSTEWLLAALVDATSILKAVATVLVEDRENKTKNHVFRIAEEIIVKEVGDGPQELRLAMWRAIVGKDWPTHGDGVPLVCLSDVWPPPKGTPMRKMWDAWLRRKRNHDIKSQKKKEQTK